MAGHECYHCKEWVNEGEAHDCWTTTESALTDELPEDLKEAWERLRDALAELGEQRIYASGTCIMFARDAVYSFVRPKRSFLELSVFLNRTIKASQVRRAERRSSTKVANIIQIRHRDEVEAPVTDWLREAYDTSNTLTAGARRRSAAKAPRARRSGSKRSKRSG